MMFNRSKQGGVERSPTVECPKRNLPEDSTTEPVAPSSEIVLREKDPDLSKEVDLCSVQTSNEEML